MSKMRIESEGGQARIFVDDIEMTSVAAVRIQMEPDRLPRVWIQVLSSEMEMTGDADVVSLKSGDDEGGAMSEDQTGDDVIDHYSADQSLVAKAGMEMAERHWGYIESLLRAHMTAEEQIDIARHHYVSAFTHGYGHGWEDRDCADLGEHIYDRCEVTT